MSLSYAELSKRLNAHISARGDSYCGVPMPLPGLGLEVAKDFPLAAEVAKMQEIIDGDEPPTSPAVDDGWRVVNEWRGTTKSGIHGQVCVLRHADGRTRSGLVPHDPTRNRFLFGPFETMDAWDLETELIAMEKLATLLNERMFKAYVLTGAFIETSKRSGLTYFFRRLRPTIVLSSHGRRREYFYADDDAEDVGITILTCLCLHPLAYYKNSFCGAMCPTDDVIAHLMLMRGDEHLFWRRANQHSAGSPNSGL